MMKNLGTADLLAKLALSLLTILSYFLGLISGTLAKVLVLLSLIVLVIYVVKVATEKTND